jgi:phosphatidylcholine synthase
MTKPPQDSLFLRARAMLVHVFTASGLIAGFMALLAINESSWQEAALWMLLAQLIDGVDGTFARWWRIRELLPGYDGKTIDFVVDFFTYAIIPAYFLYHSELLTEPLNLLAVSVILLVSGVYYGKTDMVDNDQYFIGFPVMWNLIVFFQFFVIGAVNQWFHLMLIAVFAILHFVPLRYAYPSRSVRYRGLIWTLTVLLILCCALLILWYPNAPLFLRVSALGLGAAFLVLAVHES